MFIGKGDCDAVSFFVRNKLGNSEFCAILVHFFDIKKSLTSLFYNNL